MPRLILLENVILEEAAIKGLKELTLQNMLSAIKDPVSKKDSV